MKLFKCAYCGQLLYFENSFCEVCKHKLGFDPENSTFVTLEADGDSFFFNLADDRSKRFKYCRNHNYEVCNWLLPAESADCFCEACKLNRNIPNLNDPEHLRQWRLIEVAKHRLVYTLLQLHLPVESKLENKEKGLTFDFLSDTHEKVLTGHEDGLITLNINEADDEKRELSRKQMHEPYRTLQGHFRHEVGHYYWWRLIADSNYLEECRTLFGDERQNYEQALLLHYSKGAPANWNLNFISEYATAHPSEDWAETWAHYLHIMDTLETAAAFGIGVAPGLAESSDKVNITINVNPYLEQSFDELLKQWLPLTFAMNSLNRSMGQHDMYPFVIQPKVAEKLSFIHRLCFELGVKNSDVIARVNAT